MNCMQILIVVVCGVVLTRSTSIISVIIDITITYITSE